ncbi:MAG: AMP-binding protein, partial [Candidatus Phosphoribacter sp.]
CGATMFAAVPGVYRQLLASDGLAGCDLSTLRHGLTAGEALSADLYAAWRAATGLPLYEALGMSEISTDVSCGPTVPTRVGSPGTPQAGRCVAVLPVDAADGDEPLAPGETGLLAVHRTDPGLLLRYWNRPDEDGAAVRGDWFVGGDLAHLDPDGYVIHHGRDDDVMNAGGYRVSPQEVERVLAGAPGVADVAVTEVAVRAGVRVVAAFVVPSPDGCDEGEVRAYAAEHLAAYKVPRVLTLVAELPRTANGKLLRRDLTLADPAR